jgi:hypothetical protein
MVPFSGFQKQKTPPGANLAGVKHGGAVLNARKCKKPPSAPNAILSAFRLMGVSLNY